MIVDELLKVGERHPGCEAACIQGRVPTAQ
jgi:hypothetical protein